MNDKPGEAGGRGRRHRGGRKGDVAPAASENWSTLNDVEHGRICRIRRLRGAGAVRQRLLDMGFVPNAEVAVVRSAPLMDPIEIQIGDTFVTVRRAEAAKIEVADDRNDK